MSQIHELTDRMRDRLVERFALTELGEPFDTLVRTADRTPVGSVRVFGSDLGLKVVDSRLVVPDLGIDSTMLHAFAPAHSAAPHLVSDLAGLPHGVNFHVDLVPRVDLAAEPEYLDTVYPPLSGARAAAYDVAGASPVDVPRRLLAFSSPWIVGVTVPPALVGAVGPTWDAYADRFGELVSGTARVAPQTLPTPEQLEARDRVVRRAQFDAASDPVWDFLAELVGPESVARLLGVLHDPALPTLPAPLPRS